MSYRRQSSGNPSYPSLAWSLAIALCMIDKKTINVDREYSTKQFADVMNEAHEDMEVCGEYVVEREWVELERVMGLDDV